MLTKTTLQYKHYSTIVHTVEECHSQFTLTSEMLVWNEQQSHKFHLIILPVLFCVHKNSIHCFIIELQHNHVLMYDIKLYTILHIKSSHSNFEDIMNVNRLLFDNM